MRPNDAESLGVHEGYALALVPSGLLWIVRKVWLGEINLPIIEESQIFKVGIA